MKTERTAVVTGAAGHVGCNLVRMLLRQGRRVCALDRAQAVGSPSLRGLGVDLIDADVLDPDALSRHLKGAHSVFHLAAVLPLDRNPADLRCMERVNVEGTRNVVRACIDAGVERLVHVSSIHALSPFPKREVVDETRALVPFDDRSFPVYDRSKAEGQRQVLAGTRKGLDAVIVHPTAVVGPNDFGPSAVGEALLSLAAGRLPALVQGGFNWVDVRDVVAGILAAEQRGRSGESYILGGHSLSVKELAHAVEEITRVKAPRFTSPMWLARVGAPVLALAATATGQRPLYTSESLRALRHHALVTDAKASTQLGYTKRPLSVTLTDTIEWFVASGHLRLPTGHTHWDKSDRVCDNRR